MNKRRALLMTLLSIFPLSGVYKISAQGVEKGTTVEKDTTTDLSRSGVWSIFPATYPPALEIDVPADHVLLVLQVGTERFSITAKEALDILRSK